jgi:hypothetical protein
LGIPVWVSAEQVTNPLKYEEPKFLTGRIFPKISDRKAYAFKFTRQATRSGQNLQVLREYSYPDGTMAARERLSYQGDDLISYQLEELQSNSGGRAILQRDPLVPQRDRILFEYSDDLSSRRTKIASEPLHPNTLVNDMVGPFLLSHWPELRDGKEIKCRYIVVPRRETVGFTFKRQHSRPGDPPDTVRVKMEASSPIIAALVEPLSFLIEEKPPHHVLEYQGRTTPKIRSGLGWKDFDAVTVFDWPEHASEQKRRQ